MDVDKEALAASQSLVDSMSTNLTTFSTHGGKLIFYHGDSDPSFSPLDTFEYYKNMSAANGSLAAISKWSQFYFAPGMSQCGGGQALDQFDLLGATVNWVEKGTTPTSVIATGKAFPGRSSRCAPIQSTRNIKEPEIPKTQIRSSAAEQNGFSQSLRKHEAGGQR